ncbi:MAG: hypothetical protein Q9218_005755 [Villophora microphyllina]
MSMPAGSPPGATSGVPSQLPSPFTTALLSVIIVFSVLATVAVGLRIYSTRISHSKDWVTKDLVLVIAALVVSYGAIGTTIAGANLVGLNHVGTRLDLLKSAQVTFKVGEANNNEIHFADVINTTVSGGLCKVSILEFYKRIFVTKPFKITCNTMIFLVSAWMIGTFFTTLFSTTPISSAFQPSLQQKDANFNIPTVLLSEFGIGIVLDFLILCLPLRPISKLQLSWSKKIKIYAILWLGILCVVCASVRFYYAYHELRDVFVASLQDKTTVTVNASIWGKLEPSASIIAACLPTYAPLVKSWRFDWVLRSAATYLPFRKGSRASASDSSTELKAQEYGGVSHRWQELRSQKYGHETRIERGLTQNNSISDAGYIRTTSEFTMVHQEGSEARV